MVEKAAWVNTNLPTKQRRWDFQPASQLCIRSIIARKSWGIETCLMGNPKYFSREGVEQNSRISLRASLALGETLGEKNTRDLVAQTFWPNSAQKVSRASLIATQFLWSAFANRTKSSAKKRWEKAIPPREANPSPRSHHQVPQLGFTLFSN